MDKIKQRQYLLLLWLIILLLYYPSISAELSRIDDIGLIRSLSQREDVNLKKIFIPKAEGGLYYRPILSLSFLIDKKLFFLNIPLMHLHNILLHIFNVSMVFFITREILIISKMMYLKEIPFLAGLLFGIHPICTESVNWISGRTDILAGSFILLSTFLLLKYCVRNRYFYLILSVISFVMATLSKEVAIAFLPAYLLIPISKELRKSSVIYKVSIISIIVGALYFVLRESAFISSNYRIKNTLMFISTDYWHSLFVCLRALGFYVKKFFVPYPLNFTIIDVDPLYELFAFPILILCLYLLYKRSIMGIFFIIGIFLMVPSFLILFRNIAWTPYAERYIYITTAFFTIACICYAGLYFFTEKRRKIFLFFLILIILVFTSTTFHRNLIWRKNISLLEDSIKKEPQFKETRRLYAGLLMDQGRFLDAETQLIFTKSIYMFGYDYKTDFALAELYYRMDELSKAESYIDKVLYNKPKYTEAMKLKLRILVKKALKEREDKKSVMSLVHSYDKFMDSIKEPMFHYQISKVFISLGLYLEAQKALKTAKNLLPDGDIYKEFTNKLMTRLQVKYN